MAAIFKSSLPNLSVDISVNISIKRDYTAQNRFLCFASIVYLTLVWNWILFMICICFIVFFSFYTVCCFSLSV